MVRQFEHDHVVAGGRQQVAQIAAERQRSGIGAVGPILCPDEIEEMRQPMEDSRLIHAPLGNQEMQVRGGVDPVAEGLDGDDDAGNERLARQRLKVDREGLD